MSSPTPWIKVEADGAGKVGRCERCGDVLTLRLPMVLSAVALYMLAFVEEHRHCKEPQP
jgi:hypothetical protein